MMYNILVVVLERGTDGGGWGGSEKDGVWRGKEGVIRWCIAISCQDLADFMPRFTKILMFALIELFTQ